jgi:hypothetical protein
MTFHQGCDVTVLGAADEIAFPMAGNGAVLDFRGSLPDGDGVDDLATAVSANTGLPRAADAPLGPKALN